MPQIVEYLRHHTEEGMKLVSDERIAELASAEVAKAGTLLDAYEIAGRAIRAAIQETAEACAKVCEAHGTMELSADGETFIEYDESALGCAAEIRRRAQGE